MPSVLNSARIALRGILAGHLTIFWDASQPNAHRIAIPRITPEVKWLWPIVGFAAMRERGRST